MTPDLLRLRKSADDLEEVMAALGFARSRGHPQRTL
jgi:hypothetical protein